MHFYAPLIFDIILFRFLLRTQLCRLPSLALSFSRTFCLFPSQLLLLTRLAISTKLTMAASYFFALHDAPSLQKNPLRLYSLCSLKEYNPRLYKVIRGADLPANSIPVPKKLNLPSVLEKNYNTFILCVVDEGNNKYFLIFIRLFQFNVTFTCKLKKKSFAILSDLFCTTHFTFHI